MYQILLDFRQLGIILGTCKGNFGESIIDNWYLNIASNISIHN